MSRHGAGEGSHVRPADALCGALEALGADHVFGLPGTQNLYLTEALRRSGLRWVVPSNELAAAFMANGLYRSSGRPGVVLTIPGPGFTWALTGMAEARLDSAAVLFLTGAHPGDPEGGARLQEIPQASMARPVAKEILRVSDADELVETVVRGYRAATAGEPGPVLVQVEHPVWGGSCAASLPTPPDARTSDRSDVEEIARRLAGARRPLLFVGQGCQEGPDPLRRLAEALSAPVLIGTSGRGALSEDHPLAVPLDRASDAASLADELIGRSDLVLVLGSRLSHNATLGHRLSFPADRMIRVDASAEVLREASGSASMTVHADVPGLLEALWERREVWEDAPEDRWLDRAEPPRDRALAGSGDGEGEPRVTDGPAMADFFAALRRSMPADARLVTDSGLHQMLARRHFRVDAPRAFVTPTNFQSMGYGIPAAVGAALAGPGRPTVAVVGDGGLRLSAFELATARALEVDLTVVVFVDGYFGLIRQGQIGAFGRGSGVDLPGLDLVDLASSLGVEHRRLDPVRPERTLADALAGGGVRLIEVPVEDPDGLWREAAGARAREEVRRRIGPEGTERLRSWRDRWRRWRGGGVAEG